MSNSPPHTQSIYLNFCLFLQHNEHNDTISQKIHPRLCEALYIILAPKSYLANQTTVQYNSQK